MLWPLLRPSPIHRCVPCSPHHDPGEGGQACEPMDANASGTRGDRMGRGTVLDLRSPEGWHSVRCVMSLLTTELKERLAILTDFSSPRPLLRSAPRTRPVCLPPPSPLEADRKASMRTRPCQTLGNRIDPSPTTCQPPNRLRRLSRARHSLSLASTRRRYPRPSRSTTRHTAKPRRFETGFTEHIPLAHHVASASWAIRRRGEGPWWCTTSSNRTGSSRR